MLHGKFPETIYSNEGFYFHHHTVQITLSIITKNRCRTFYTHFIPTSSAVALDTKKTKAGLILFPPALNICSAADIKTGFSAPTIYQQSIFIRLKP